MSLIGGSRQGAPLVRVLLAQAAGALIAFVGAFGLVAWFGIRLDLFFVLAAGGTIAAWLGERYLRLPRWWIPAQMAMPPAAALISSLDLPTWIYLAGFFVLLTLYWNAARGRVPLYLTNEVTRQALNDLLPEKPRLRFLDLGHGFGGTVLALADARPQQSFTGIESAPLPFVISRLRSLFAGAPNARLDYGDFWKRDLRPYDVVYAFLSPVPMQALYAKARAELSPGSLLISNSFPIPERAADDVRILGDRRGTRLFVYRI